ncbi:MAG: hypothetical protein ACE5GH_05120 [Fidelibacterota bacterium]
MKSVPEAVQEAIRSTGWSDALWGRKLDVTTHTVWSWRNGKHQPHRRNIEAIGRVLGKKAVFNEDESRCEFRAMRQELPTNIHRLIEGLKWDHWTTGDGREMRFDRSTGEMQEYDGDLNKWVTLGTATENSLV